jgi:hypothetical protein
MSQPEAPLICPACGAQMNQHATKIDYSIEEATYGQLSLLLSIAIAYHLVQRTPSS